MTVFQLGRSITFAYMMKRWVRDLNLPGHDTKIASEQLRIVSRVSIELAGNSMDTQGKSEVGSYWDPAPTSSKPKEK